MKIFTNRPFIVPRWIILIADTVISTASFVLSYFILQEFRFPLLIRGHFFIYAGLFVATSLTVFYAMRIYRGLIRYSNTKDMFRIFSAVLVVSLIYPVVSELVAIRLYRIPRLDMPTLLVLNFFISSSLLIMLRTSIKEVYILAKGNALADVKRVLIYGSDQHAILIKQAIEAANNEKVVVSGFIQSGGKKINSNIEQKRVYHSRELADLHKKFNINKVILPNSLSNNADVRRIIDQCLNLGIQVQAVPPSEQWVSGKLSMGQMQDLRIEDLLPRKPIEINNQLVSKEIYGKRVLITGAAGSIGSEIARQVMSYNPEMVVLCDQAESPLHEMQLELEEGYPAAKIKTFIASIRNLRRMIIPFKEYRPHIVFHAAAYKHVPMMEKYPEEAILTNVMGTRNMADLSVCFGVEKFIMISTDKAVNPTNIMGASKRIAETYVQSLNSSSFNPPSTELLSDLLRDADDESISVVNNKTRFITTRFGNVLGSNGSVIPRFRSQIQHGGPITVTHPEITRYFMTIPEAVQLVLEAATMGNGGEIFVFDMGQPVKIADLAKNMIKLAGLVPDKDINIVYTGLRPGEKLYEELLNEKEKTLPTHHEKIKIAKVVSRSYKEVLNDIENLTELCKQGDHFKLVGKMKLIIPEFISNNSEFAKLDDVKGRKKVLFVPAFTETINIRN
ncbi:polysaccharide biosynthesis protein [Terrimonas sp.]|uniref:polysaccharide biosynthesis protein n=1 Tax=Terrimonas sp. TaxID=1914338 RepID=UPI000D5190E6|nr:nucleoside-diphosphate sugar epimerase/dehydratase [Terrimonas sp.]PVD51714.1 polysaccharide biosynthesis protein [Terrimonas sp.]